MSTLAVLAWWTLTGDSDREGGFQGAPLPSVVAGGGRLVKVALHNSVPVSFVATFGCGDAEDDNEIGGRADLATGDHELTFDVSGDCNYAILEAGTAEPPVGAKLAWQVTIDGRTWDEESSVLERPLAPGYGFFLQTGWEDGSLNEYLAYRAGD